jgi:hypothetical protein
MSKEQTPNKIVEKPTPTPQPKDGVVKGNNLPTYQAPPPPPPKSNK